MEMGDWVLGIEDWGLAKTHNTQSPIPNPQKRDKFGNKNNIN